MQLVTGLAGQGGPGLQSLTLHITYNKVSVVLTLTQRSLQELIYLKPKYCNISNKNI